MYVISTSGICHNLVIIFKTRRAPAFAAIIIDFQDQRSISQISQAPVEQCCYQITQSGGSPCHASQGSGTRIHCGSRF